jgi:hypothetical protein
MEKQRWFVAAICAVVLGLLGGTSWAAEKIMEIKVPFDFNVQGATLPSGSYTLIADGANNDEVVLQSSSGDVTQLPVVTRLADNGRNKAYLVFDKDGGDRFLSEIHMPGKDGYAIQGASGTHEHMTVPTEDK